MADQYGAEISRESFLQDTGGFALTAQEQTVADEITNTLLIGSEDPAARPAGLQNDYQQVASLNLYDTTPVSSITRSQEETTKANELARVLT